MTMETAVIESIEIANSQKLTELIEKIKSDGTEKFHVLADFDSTLTVACVDGKPMPSMICILREGDYLSAEYPSQARALFQKYGPIEKDPNIPDAEKKTAMEEWSRMHFELLIKNKLTKSILEKAINSGQIKFREGILEFVETLRDNNIPLVILSASALGDEAIDMCLKKEGYYFDNIHVISNSLIWDEEEKIVGVQEPIIHGMNKDETDFQNHPIFETIKDRKNVLLLGDNISDIQMVKNFDYANLIKIGFLNQHSEERLKKYKENFDITITNDGTFDGVNKILKEILF